MLSTAVNNKNRIAGASYDAAGNLLTYPSYGSYTGVYPEPACGRQARPKGRGKPD